jgi:hypothetical protein
MAGAINMGVQFTDASYCKQVHINTGPVDSPRYFTAILPYKYSSRAILFAHSKWGILMYMFYCDGYERVYTTQKTFMVFYFTLHGTFQNAGK